MDAAARVWIALALLGAFLLPVAAHASGARQVIPFTGTLDMQAGRLTLDIGRQGASAAGIVLSHPAPARYDLSADLRHVPAGPLDVAAQLEGRFELTGPSPEKRELVGEVHSRYTLLNYKPVRDLDLRFAVRDRTLAIERLRLGVFSGVGRLGLVGRRDLDLTVGLDGFELEGLWGSLQAGGMQTPPLTGVVSGEATLKGAWGRPYITGHLAFYNGRLKGMDYVSAQLHLEGVYPRLVLREGLVTPYEGPGFRVSGPVDVTDLSRLPDELRQLRRELVVSDDGSGATWAFRRLSPSGDHMTQLKAFIRDGVEGHGEAAGGDGILGVQKRIGF